MKRAFPTPPNPVEHDYYPGTRIRIDITDADSGYRVAEYDCDPQEVHELIKKLDGGGGTVLEAKYLASGGNRCPVCGSDQLMGEPFEADSDRVSQIITCEKCLSEWRDIHTLTGMDIITHNEQKEHT